MRWKTLIFDRDRMVCLEASDGNACLVAATGGEMVRSRAERSMVYGKPHKFAKVDHHHRIVVAADGNLIRDVSGWSQFFEESWLAVPC